MAAIQPIDKLFAQPNFGGPNGPVTPGSPSIEVGLPSTLIHALPGGDGGRQDPQNCAKRQTFQWVGWLARALLNMPSPTDNL